MTKRLDGRIAVVTGASRGIGYAIARQLASGGAHVIAMARTVGGLEELDDEIKAAGGNATLVPADLRDMDAIDRLGAAVFERWGKLDILVGNAGVLGKLSPVGHIEAKVWEETIAVNLTANWRLIRSLDPLLQRSDAGRALFLTSDLTHIAKPFHSAYASSKAALEMLVKIYSAENETTAVNVNLLSPGPVRTALRARAMPGEDPSALTRPREIAELVTDLVTPAQTANGAVFEFCGGRLVQH